MSDGDGSDEFRRPTEPSAPWERRWVSRSPAPGPGSSQPGQPPPAGDGSEPRRALDGDVDRPTVAEIVDRVGPPDEGGRPADGTGPTGGPGPVRAAVVLTRLQDKKARRQQRTSLLGRIAVGVSAVLVLAITGAAWAGLRYVDSRQQQVQALDPQSADIRQPDAQLGDENFLLIGSDTRAGESGRIGAGDAELIEGARSDTTMIAHVPADRSRVVVVSFPRDLQVDIPTCQRWDNDTASYTSELVPPQEGVKLNEAYFDGGPRCITKVVQQLSGLSINHFLGVDFAGFQSMVDSLGGVEVCTEQPLTDAKLGSILPVAGTQTIDGQQALDYVRARMVTGDPTSDYGRIQRQQQFLSSLLRTALSRDTLLDLGKLKGFVDAVTASTFGENVGVDQLLALAQSLQGVDAGKVSFITAPTTGEANAAGNEVLLDDANDALFRTIIDGTPLPGEEVTPPDPTNPSPSPSPSPAPTPTPGSAEPVAVDPGAVSVVVRNATTISGLAAGVARELSALGFGIEALDDFPDATTGIVVRHGGGDAAEAAARTLASTVPGARIQVVPVLGGTVELVLAEDPGGTLVAPTRAGTPLAAPSAADPVAPLPDDLAVVNAGEPVCS